MRITLDIDLEDVNTIHGMKVSNSIQQRMLAGKLLDAVQSTATPTPYENIKPIEDDTELTAVVTAPLNELKKFAKWGTYGKGGKEPLHYVRLIDCSTEHLEAILRTQPHVKHIPGYVEIITSILEDRKR